MGGKVNYTVVGLFVVLLTALLIAFALWLGDSFSKEAVYNRYITYLNESVTGLNVNSPVKFNGVAVGFVEQVAIDKADPKRVELLLSLEQGTPVTKDTYALIKTQGLTGIGYIELNPQGNNNELLLPSSTDPIPVIPSKLSFLGLLEDKISELTQNLETLSENLNAVLDTQNKQNLKDSLAALNQTLQSAQQISHNTAIASEQFPQVVDSIQHSADAFRTMSISVNKTSQQINKTMQSGQLAIDAFSTQVVPSAVDVLARIQSVMSNWGLLSAQLRQNPAILIRGSTPAPPGPGEKEQH